MSRHNRRRQRGSIYVLVLGTAMIVSIIGLSTLVVARVHGKIATSNRHELQARFAAPAIAEVVVHRIGADAGWRTTYTDDTWTAHEFVGPVRFRFKLVDELDSDLADDPLEPVRLYADANVGQTVRIYSVQLLPDVDDADVPLGTVSPVTGTWRQEVLP